MTILYGSVRKIKSFTKYFTARLANPLVDNIVCLTFNYIIHQHIFLVQGLWEWLHVWVASYYNHLSFRLVIICFWIKITSGQNNQQGKDLTRHRTQTNSQSSAIKMSNQTHFLMDNQKTFILSPEASQILARHCPITGHYFKLLNLLIYCTIPLVFV